MSAYINEVALMTWFTEKEAEAQKRHAALMPLMAWFDHMEASAIANACAVSADYSAPCADGVCSTTWKPAKTA